MKQGLIIIVLGAIASFVILGCGSSGSDSNSNQVCTAVGCFTPGTGIVGLGTLPPNAVVLYSEGPLTVSNSGKFDDFLRSIGACNSLLNTCSGYDLPPAVQVELDDYTFPTNTTTTGNLTIYLAAGPINAVVDYRLINNSTGFATGIQTGPSINGLGTVTGTGGLLQVIMSGKSTDSQVAVQLTYNNNVIASGILYRQATP